MHPRVSEPVLSEDEYRAEEKAMREGLAKKQRDDVDAYNERERSERRQRQALIQDIYDLKHRPKPLGEPGEG